MPGPRAIDSPIVLSLSLGFLMAPLVQTPAALSIFSGAGLLAAVQEVLIGVAIGMIFLGERLASTAAIGLVLVIAGVLSMTLPARRRAA